MTTMDNRSRWLALLVLCLGDLMIVLDVTIVGARPRCAKTSASPETSLRVVKRLPADLRGLLPAAARRPSGTGGVPGRLSLSRVDSAVRAACREMLIGARGAGLAARSCPPSPR